MGKKSKFSSNIIKNRNKKIPAHKKKIATDLFQQNRLKEANTVCQSIVQSYTHDPDIWMILGITNANFGHLSEAEKNFNKAITIQPDNSKAHYYLGLVFMNLGNHAKAIKHLKIAIRNDKYFADAYCNLGHLQIQNNQEDEAVKNFETALKINPTLADATIGIVKIMAQRGNFSEAYDLLLPLISKGNNNANAIKIYSDLCIQLGKENTAVEFLEQNITLCKDNVTRQSYHFCLGDLFDKLADYSKAFTHYRKANELSNYPSNLEMEIKKTNSLKQYFRRDTLESLPKPSINTSKPVFIVGMPRSGTSLVEQIISSHPEAYGGGELYFITDIAQKLPSKLNTDSNYPNCMQNISQEIIDHSVESYLEQISKFTGDEKKVTDKMPHNFLHLGLIQVLFPNARIIHCKRDPRDTCLSIYFKPFNAQHSYSYFLRDLGIYYRNYESLMDHWQQQLDIPILTVNYEDLIQNSRDSISQMLKFIDLPWNDACEQFHKSERRVSTPSFAQVRNALHNKSISRWKNYETELEPLFSSLGPEPQI